MKIDFWSSTEYSGFMAGLIRELTALRGDAGASGALRCDARTSRARGLEARQRYQISEASYRAAKSPGARLFLRFRQYVAYPMQLIAALTIDRIRFFSFRLFSGRLFGSNSDGSSSKRKTGELKTGEPVGRDVCVVSTNTFLCAAHRDLPASEYGAFGL